MGVSRADTPFVLLERDNLEPSFRQSKRDTISLITRYSTTFFGVMENSDLLEFLMIYSSPSEVTVTCEIISR